MSGCSTGIGEATAKLLADKGWTVYAGVRKEADAEKLRNYSTSIRPLFLDVTKPDQIAAAIEEVRVGVGSEGLDALVNNAGMACSGPVEFMSMEDVTRQFDINVFGVIRLTQAAMPLIRMGKPGRVVNVGSVGAENVLPYLGVYDSTKSAIQAINQSLRQELGRFGVKVILVKPGPVKTNFDKASLVEHDRYMKQFTPDTDCYKYYGKDLENLPKAGEPFQNMMAAPIVVGQRILQALTERSPRNVLYDTWGSWLTSHMILWMPAWLYDYFMGRIFFV